MSIYDFCMSVSSQHTSHLHLHCLICNSELTVVPNTLEGGELSHFLKSIMLFAHKNLRLMNFTQYSYPLCAYYVIRPGLRRGSRCINPPFNQT